MKNVYMCEFNLMMGESVYLPIATSSLVAYAKTNATITQHYCFMPYCFIKKPISEILESMEEPSVLVLSLSLWNYKYSLLLAKAVKNKYPGCTVICGGPSVPFDPTNFFTENPFLDITCRGEGELMFSEILLELLKNEEEQDLSLIDGISYFRNGQVFINPKEHDVFDLNKYVSPYLSGEFDYLFRDEDSNFEYQIILETNRGCPFQCGYCFWGRGDIPRMRYFPLEMVYKTIEWLGEKRIQYVFCADSNFGIVERDVAIASYLAKTKKQYGYPAKFRVCFAKNSLSRIQRIGEILAASELSKSTTVSLQSRNSDALKNIKRNNISMKEFEEFIKGCALKKIPTYTEFILGFPGETYQSFLDGIRDILDTRAHNEIFVYLCTVLPNTYIATPEFQKKFKIQKKRIPLMEIHCNVHNVSDQDDLESEYVQEYEEIISGCDTLSVTDIVRIMSIMALFQMLYSLQLAYVVIVYLTDICDFDVIGFIEFLVDSCDTDILPQNNFLRKNAEACTRIYTNTLVDGKGRASFAPQYGSIYWEIEETCFLDDICLEREQLIYDMENAFIHYLDSQNIAFDQKVLKDVITYQSAILPCYRHNNKNTVHLNYNWDTYLKEHGVLTKGGSYRIQYPEVCYESLEEFAKKVVLWGRKGGIYFNRLTKEE